MKKIITLFITIIILLVSSYGCSFDTKSIEFKNYDEASKYIENGWISKSLPKNSKDISLIYNIDTNEINGKFTTTKNESEKLKEICLVATIKELIDSDKGLNANFKKAKTNLEKSDKADFLYKDDNFIFAFSDDETIYFFGKNK